MAMNSQGPLISSSAQPDREVVEGARDISGGNIRITQQSQIREKDEKC